VQKLQKSIDSLEKSLDNVAKVTGKIAEGEGTVGRLVQNDTVARNLEQITDDAGSLVRGISKLQTIVGLRTEYNYLANTFKSYFMVTLQPRPDKFYLIEVVDDPRGYREAIQRVEHSSDKGFVSTNTITTSEKLRISFQFGKRIGPLTGRFGIKESTGGAGFDIHMLDDHLALSADIFDTRSNQYPRVQGRVGWSIYKTNLYLIGGVDDVLNYTRARGLGGQFFDWFFGLQLVFNDEDLKSFLLFGGSGAVSAAGK
jgi:phospholipid/cholesterol/gamma-HCH transport system substrate-binding protein